mmetsp:Transcript_8713/g.7266  ORF Transcript_8713/g.7266 Transcript_8713/m.7266 type:complete len:115 (+) Transcript_8713:56-400(+)
MPKSKRNQVVNLTKVSKRQTRDRKDKAIEEIRECLEKFRFAYVLKLENQRNNLLKALRDDLKPGRLFCGRNKVMQVALGVDAEKLNKLALLRSERLARFANFIIAHQPDLAINQ